MNAANLFVRARVRDCWTITPGDPAALVERLPRIKAPAFVRLDDGRIIGYSYECDGHCDLQRSHRWHWVYEAGEPWAGMDGCPWIEVEVVG